MPYLIDGHNLIPKIPGLSLESLDDEIQLIILLQDFCRHQRKDAEVFFDKAPPAQVRKQRFGRVTAHFVSQETTADRAIQQRLAQLAGEAQNWTVVSSDRAVQSAARRARAQILSSESLADQIHYSSQFRNQPHRQSPQPPGEDHAETISSSEEEIEEWLRLFGAKGSTHQGKNHPSAKSPPDKKK